MKIVQILPALNSGGVERGTVEFAAELVRRGHDSIVVSNGGPLVRQLEAQGSVHIAQPVHRKSPVSFGQILPLRRLLQELQPDVVHVRSRMPAWITRLALRGIPANERPVVVSTFHGMYSVNPYSAIMAKADHIIAVSDCVRHYILDHFKVAESKLTVIQRGVDVDSFRSQTLCANWATALTQEHPQLAGKRLIMMPGRISRWKGQLLFLEAMAEIVRQNPDCHGIVVGGVEPGKDRFMDELLARRAQLGLDTHITFLGQRRDMAELYLASDLVCHMSTKPEPFGRTVTEALASGTPVMAFDRGGAAETLRACFPEGLVEPDNTHRFATAALRLLSQPVPTIEVPERFHLKAQTEATLAIYQRLVAGRKV